MTDYYKQRELEKNYMSWMFDEFIHGLTMQAPLYPPAGSMLASKYPDFPPSHSVFHRPDTKK